MTRVTGVPGVAAVAGEQPATTVRPDEPSPGALAIDVVIPTVGRPSLGPLLAGLVADPPSVQGTIVVVDDRRGSQPALDVPEGVVVLRSGGRGPAAARNVGWRYGAAPWVVFLDDDVRLTAGWAAALRRDLAALGPFEAARLVASQGRVRVPLAAGRRPTDNERDVAGLAHAPWITAELAVSRWALGLSGGFDEGFPRAYREDTDLALRLVRGGVELRRGARCVEHPAATRPWFDSIRRQAGNADDARLARRHGRGWRHEAGVPAGRFRRHVAVSATLVAAAASLGRRRLRAISLASWLAATAWTTWERVRPGPRTPSEWAAMALTSAAIPPLAVGWRLIGTVQARRDRRPPARAVLFDRDGTLVHDVAYNGDPERVVLRAGAQQAVQRARRAGLAVGLITNQSGVARGLLTAGDVDAVHSRLESMLGPFDVVVVCPHGEDDRCPCRKPAPGMVLEAARRLVVPPDACWVVGDIGADVQAAHQAGARAVLVPAAATRPEEIRLAARVAANLDEALDVVLGARR
jgi:histidinol-phosphate phosphatase family protein